uniref:Thioesterase domain-containing protein n=1 Tax=Bos mutus grunniens TaxID=30521 RepID=A0A8B9XLJ7_BOSMU
MTSWVSRLLPRNGRSLATASENQRAEDHHRHQEAYGYFLPIQTRWQDNDQYGHVNNVVYYSYFDTIINQYLISAFFQEKQHSILCVSVFGPERVLRAVFKRLTHDRNLPLSPISGQPHSAFHCGSLAFVYCGLKTGLLTSPMVGFMVTNQCTFHTPVSFPQIPVAALAVEKVGHSSVHYRLALFPPKPTKETPSVSHWDLSDGFFFGHPKLAHFASLACTTGSSVHIFVNPATSKPLGLPEDFRRGLLRLMSPAPG